MNESEFEWRDSTVMMTYILFLVLQFVTVDASGAGKSYVLISYSMNEQNREFVDLGSAASKQAGAPTVGKHP